MQAEACPVVAAALEYSSAFEKEEVRDAMIERRLILFEKPGPENTQATIEAAKERAELLGIRQVVAATNTGDTALRATQTFQGTQATIIGVTLHAGWWKTYQPPDPEIVRQAEQLGVHFLTGTHTLSGGVSAAAKTAFGGLPDTELISHVYYTLGQGVKVAVEVAIMAADAGLLDMQKEAIAIAGTGRGADTALVLKPVYSCDFFNLKIAEIIAMPR